MANLIGRTLGKYRIVARLGRGGMAEVYKAYQPGLNRYVAIKVLHSNMVDETDFVARFEREALAVGKLRHSNIVQAFDFDQDGDISYMAIEFIDGPTLKDEVQARHATGQPFTLKEIARIFIALCNAIDYAHAHGMVHRDLKPANVMINPEGQVVLTDFGISRMVGSATLTKTGMVSGTPAYMSPEQGQGQHGDERSDIYSLGVMLYEMVTGAVPFDADTPFAIILKHISQPVPPPRHVVPHLPAEVEQIILKAMAKEPAGRYQRAGEMAAALRQAVNLTPGEEYLPLPIIAPRPEIKELDPTAQHFSKPVKPPTHPVQPVVTPTLPLAPHPATVIQAPPVQKKSVLPFLVGGLFLLLILTLAGVAVFLYSRSRASTNEVQGAAAATAAAINATGTAGSSANATETASAQAVAAAALTAPTQTAQAATLSAEATALQLTRDAELIVGVQQAVGATQTAIAQAAATATTAAQQAGATQTAIAQTTTIAGEQARATQTVVAQATAVAGEQASATQTAVAQAAAQAAEVEAAAANATAAAAILAQAAATAQAKAAQVQAAPKGTFNDFETSLTWRRGDEPNGTLERSTAEVHSGDYAGKLDYKFSTPGNDYVVFLWSQGLGGQPNQITAWVNGEGAGHFLNVWVKDSAGETWQFSFGQVKHTGWQQMTALLSPTQPWPAGHIDGPDNEIIDYPISFQALVLDDGSDDFNGSGTIYLDDLASSEGTLPPTAVPTLSPAVFFQADRPTVGAGGCAILSWSVQNVSAVYLDGAPVTGQESRQVCPPATTTYTLHVVNRDGSSSDVPVTITVQ